MDLYHVWCNLKPGVSDLEFVERLQAYLGHLEAEGALAGWRITRRKLGLSGAALPEFHIILEFEGLAQLDEAFHQASGRAEPVEGLHHCVNSLVTDATFALYRDFPDAHRQRGQEKF